MKGLKVVLTGHTNNPDPKPDERFSIVKIGDYKTTSDSCIQALRDGIFDKHHETASEFTAVSFEVGDTVTDDVKETTVCTFQFKKICADKDDPATTIVGKAVYTKLLHS